MLYLLVCQQCMTAIRVVGDMTEADYVLTPFVTSHSMCWTDTCPGPAQVVHQLPAELSAQLETRELSVGETWVALNGFGMPEEQECSPAAVKAAFTESPVRNVAVHPVRGSHRSQIEFIELENGTKIHFGSGPVGALVYRISKPHSYAKKVEDEIAPEVRSGG